MELDRNSAGVLCHLIETLEDRTNHNVIREVMEGDGYSFDEVDRALKALGKIAGYDIGWA